MAHQPAGRWGDQCSLHGCYTEQILQVPHSDLHGITRADIPTFWTINQIWLSNICYKRHMTYKSLIYRLKLNFVFIDVNVLKQSTLMKIL